MKVKLVLLVFLLLVPVMAQDSLLNYPGIPIIMYGFVPSCSVSTSDAQQMKDMGVYAYVAVDMKMEDYERLSNEGLKLIPYQISDSVKNDIVKYTDAVYTEWEAEGKGDGSNGDTELQYNDSIGSKVTEGGRECVMTDSQSNDTLIYGPGYFQYIDYKVVKDTNRPFIFYNLKYDLMIKKINPSLPVNGADTVCILEITGSDYYVTRDSLILPPKVLTVNDFASINVWETLSWTYNLSGLSNDLSRYRFSTPPNNFITNGFMQFKIIWKGAGKNIKLFVDKITVYDDRGNNINFNSNIRNRIILQVNEYKNLSNSAVIQWHPMDEPFSIDNYEPFRIVEELVNSTDPSLHLKSSFTCGYNGRYGESGKGTHQVSKTPDFIKRAKPKNIGLNLLKTRMQIYYSIICI